MLLLGLILLAVTGAFTGLLIADNLTGGPDYTVTVLGHDIATMSSLAIFLAGIALALLFALGGLLALSGAARARRRSVRAQAVGVRAGDAPADRDVLTGRPGDVDTGDAVIPDRPAQRERPLGWRHRLTH